ncbi:MAG: hypothetical protein ACLFPJ_06150 [Candidatus Woesearchaeota archaeon]
MGSKFYFNNGFTAQDIDSLVSCLESIDDNTFKYHCNIDKNDFYNWIDSGLLNKKVANSIKRIKTKKGLIKKLKLIK